MSSLAKQKVGNPASVTRCVFEIFLVHGTLKSRSTEPWGGDKGLGVSGAFHWSCTWWGLGVSGELLSDSRPRRP